ncbi:cytochrome P450 [Kribbella yunnanensis]|uniref:Cytochrome P450 n=1 Tax=Kribbella yunnanensis TaxID=190194 RepID=A0ABN2IWY3_9ACTN
MPITPVPDTPHGSGTGFDGPRSAIDLWSPEALTDPFPHYAALRELGPAVWLDRYEVVVLPRFAEVRAALADWKRFSSAAGVGLDPKTNAEIPPGVLGIDPPEHTAARHGLTRELSPGRVAAEQERLGRIAADVVAPLLAGEKLDVVTDIAAPYVSAVIGELAGLPAEVTDGLAPLAARAFNLFGPAGEVQRDGLIAFEQLVGQAIASAAGPEEIERTATYMFPGVDTTVAAVATTLYLFARHPEQWTLLRNDPSLIPAAGAEALRLHSPVRHFTRLTTEPVVVGDSFLPVGTRVLILYGSANRDERRFPDPARFDITRLAHQHLAYGHGVHRCVGANLAQREIDTLLEVLVPRVRAIQLHNEPAWSSNLTIHGLSSLTVSAARA